MKLLILTAVLFLSTFARAEQKVETRFKGSKSDTSMTLDYRYSGNEDSIWSSEVSYTGTRSKVKNSNDQTEVTRDIQWINSWDLPKSWFVELGLGTSSTKVNKLRTGNAELTFGRTHEDWHFFNWSISGGVNNLKQTEGVSSGASELNLTQSKIGFQIGIEPIEWLSVSFFSDKFDYNKDVDQEISKLQNDAAIERYGTAFSDQLTSLVDHDSGITLGFKMSDFWKLSLTATQTEDAPEPHVKGKSVSAKLYHKFNSQWDGSLTLGSSHYESTPTTPSAQYGYAGFGVGYAW